MRTFFIPLFSVVLACPGVAAGASPADELPQAASSGDEAGSAFYSRINLLGFGLYQDLKSSTLNPGNALGIPKYQAEVDLRPDFNLTFRYVEFGLKPRVQRARTKVELANGKHLSDTRDDAFVNEGFVRFRPTDQLLLNYGRENLQWGPSALLSPSNPFNANNGRNNPNLELPGMDYARAVFIPGPALTVSLIANTGKGRLQQPGPYRKTYAVKADYTGDGHFFTLLASRRDGDTNRIGAFGGWNVSDALLIHAEGSAGKKSDLSPSGKRDRQLLVGGSYTLESGPTLSAEFFLNNGGCAGAPVGVCLTQRNALSDLQHPLIRRRYAMLQYVDTKIGDNMNLSARLIRNLDDKSAQLVINLEYELGEHWQVFAIPTLYHGRDQSEFGSLLRNAMFIGASYTF